MTRKPRTLLLVAAVGAVVFFLLGAPEISEGTGTVPDVVAWLSLVVAVVTLAALALYPGLWVLWLSLQYRIPVFSISRWAGFEHYAFLAVDTRFWNAAWASASVSAF